MRVTAAGSGAQSVAAVQAAADRLSGLQLQLSSGKRISTASDDPAGTVDLLGLRAAKARSSQYGEASADALAWLSTADSAYSQGASVLQSARTLVLRALNTGGNADSTSAAIADQVDGLRKTLISIANTAYAGRPVFGGATAGAAAYAADGSYVGDTGSVTRAVATGTTVDVGAVGTTVFGSGADDVFATLAGIADSLRTSPPTLTAAALGDIDAALDRLTSAQATEGTTYRQVQQMTTVRTATDAVAVKRMSDIEEIDYAEVAVRMAAANTAYQAALQSTAAVSRVSLLDFLK